MLDPGKFYFLRSDINQFAPISEKIDELIGKADCQFITDIHKVFLRRVAEKNSLAESLLAKPFKFDVAEEMSIGKQEWLTEPAKLNERWRKRIKFQVMTMKEPDG